MTRGQIAIIVNENGENKIYTSTEFNGDMYYDGHGQEVCEMLKNVNNKQEYEDAVKTFNENNFNYDDTPLTFDMSEDYRIDELTTMSDKYFDIWFSDYVYFKNLTDEKIVFVTRDCKKIILSLNKIGWLNFGKISEKYRSENGFEDTKLVTTSIDDIIGKKVIVDGKLGEITKLSGVDFVQVEFCNLTESPRFLFKKGIEKFFADNQKN